jgi:acetyl esterase/lipase
MSAELHVAADTPPAFIWHTAADDAVPVENSLLFASALRARRVPFELHVFPHGTHGLGLAAGDPVVGAWTALCAGWLAAMGWVGARRPGLV